MRECKVCNERKPLDLFVKHKECKGGRTSTCKECRNKWGKSYYDDNKSKILATQKASVEKRKSEGKDVNKPIRDYAKRNPHHKRYYAAQRKYHVKRATPPWLTKDQKKDIRTIYNLRSKFEDVSGVKYHVDHIIPLRGENICGLNVPWNLQILEAGLNMAKSNKYN
jgi:hypothetical protein